MFNVVNYLYNAEFERIQLLFSGPKSTSAGNGANNTAIEYPSNEQQGMKIGMALFISGFVILIIGVITLFVLSRIF